MTAASTKGRTRAADAAEATKHSQEGSTAAVVHPEASSEAKRLAAAILEVLAGLRGPGEAADMLGISLARYYQIENRALEGLLAGCEPRRRGRGQLAPNELVGLRRECDRLRRECARQQALVRAAQKTVGLTPPAPVAPASEKAGRKRRRRRPKARALKMAALLREQHPHAQEEATDARDRKVAELKDGGMEPIASPVENA